MCIHGQYISVHTHTDTHTYACSTHAHAHTHTHTHTTHTHAHTCMQHAHTHTQLLCLAINYQGTSWLYQEHRYQTKEQKLHFFVSEWLPGILYQYFPCPDPKGEGHVPQQSTLRFITLHSTTLIPRPATWPGNEAMKKGEPALETRVTSLVTRPSLLPVCKREERGRPGRTGNKNTIIAFYITGLSSQTEYGKAEATEN